MTINLSQTVGWPTELASGMTTSATVLIGTLKFNPVLIIFDNQGTHSIAVSVNDSSGATVWRTFPAGEALVLDLRNQHAQAPNFTIRLGDTFYGTGTTGDTFSISYIYASVN